MKPKAYCAGLFALSLVVTSNAAVAQSVDLVRCNRLGEDGIYLPVLIITLPDGISVHPLNADGLTRSIVFSESAAIAWSSSKLGLDPASTRFTYSANCGIAENVDRPLVMAGGPGEPGTGGGGDGTGDGIIAGEGGDDNEDPIDLGDGSLP